jgi:hypothetical protein
MSGCYLLDAGLAKPIEKIVEQLAHAQLTRLRARLTHRL